MYNFHSSGKSSANVFEYWLLTNPEALWAIETQASIRALLPSFLIFLIFGDFLFFLVELWHTSKN